MEQLYVDIRRPLPHDFTNIATFVAVAVLMPLHALKVRKGLELLLLLLLLVLLLLTTHDYYYYYYY